MSRSGPYSSNPKMQSPSKKENDECTIEELLQEQKMVLRDFKCLLTSYNKLEYNNIIVTFAEEVLQWLRSKWERFQKSHVHLELRATRAERQKHPYFSENHYLQAETEYNQIRELFCKMITSLKNAEKLSETKGLAESDCNMKLNIVKLPPIPLPKFAGDYMKWQSFSDQFKSLVTKNVTLTDNQRLYYLQNCVEGSAAMSISHVSNFVTAWQILQNRYDNKRFVVATTMRELLNLKSVADEEGLGLEELYNQANGLLSTLKNLGRPVEQWDDFLVAIITMKFDRQSLEEWEYFLGARSDPPSYADLSAFINERIISQQIVRIALNRESTSNPPSSTSANKDHCIVCRSTHIIYKCHWFKRMCVVKRREIIKKKGCCFNCLKLGHTVSSCSSSGLCGHCGGQHHTLLHID